MYCPVDGNLSLFFSHTFRRKPFLQLKNGKLRLSVSVFGGFDFILHNQFFAAFLVAFPSFFKRSKNNTSDKVVQTLEMLIV